MPVDLVTTIGSHQLLVFLMLNIHIRIVYPNNSNCLPNHFNVNSLLYIIVCVVPYTFGCVTIFPRRSNSCFFIPGSPSVALTVAATTHRWSPWPPVRCFCYWLYHTPPPTRPALSSRCRPSIAASPAAPNHSWTVLPLCLAVVALPPRKRAYRPVPLGRSTARPKDRPRDHRRRLIIKRRPRSSDRSLCCRHSSRRVSRGTAVAPSSRLGPATSHPYPSQVRDMYYHN